jgi:hypothetical protein
VAVGADDLIRLPLEYSSKRNRNSSHGGSSIVLRFHEIDHKKWWVSWVGRTRCEDRNIRHCTRQEDQKSVQRTWVVSLGAGQGFRMKQVVSDNLDISLLDSVEWCLTLQCPLGQY